MTNRWPSFVTKDLEPEDDAEMMRRWELYDLKRDPGEKTNLAGNPADAALFAALRAKLVTFEERPR